MRGRVLSLCDVTGRMVQPWVDAGFEAHCVDLQHLCSEVRAGVHWHRADILEWEPPAGEWCAVFAFPPCTHLASSGARWWAAKGPGALAGALALVNRCQTIIRATGAPGFIENPRGRLGTQWRKKDCTFSPHHYAGWCEDDNYTKTTDLWTYGGFTLPPERPGCRVVSNFRIRDISPGPNRHQWRSATPVGFARATFDHLVAA